MVPAPAGVVHSALRPAAHIDTPSPTSTKEETGITAHSCTQDDMSETDGGASSDEDGAAEQYQLSDTDGGESSDEEDVAKHNIAPTVGTTDASEVVGCKGDADLASAVGTTDASELAGTAGDVDTNMDIECGDGTSTAPIPSKKSSSDTVCPNGRHDDRHDDHDKTKQLRPRNIAASVAAFAGSLAKWKLTLDPHNHVATMVGVWVMQVNNCMDNYCKRFQKHSRDEDENPQYMSYTSLTRGGGGNASGRVSPDK